MDFRLILKKITSKLSTSEQEVFEKWVNKKKEHADYFNNVKNNIFEEDPEHFNLDKKWEALKMNLERKPKNKARNFYITASAVGILLIGFCFYFYNITPNIDNSISTESLVFQNRPVLILDDGTQVLLNTGKSFSTERVQSKDNTLIYTQENDIQNDELIFNELIIPRGGDYKVILSDGTLVMLNSDTKIRYPETFQKDMPRVVELVYGEAFFNVTAKSDEVSSSSVFQVKTANQTIHVLGTEFNVANYSERNQIETTLLNGRVQLHSPIDALELKPGQQAVIDNSGYFEVHDVNTDYVIAWIRGEHKFKNEPLEEIMLRISYWYDVQVQFESEDLRQINFNGVFNKNQKLENILNQMKQGDIINYEIINDRVVIKNSSNSSSKEE